MSKGLWLEKNAGCQSQTYFKVVGGYLSDSGESIGSKNDMDFYLEVIYRWFTQFIVSYFYYKNDAK